jgi:predicted DNA binding CopG/RHH family protein
MSDYMKKDATLTMRINRLQLQRLKDKAREVGGSYSSLIRKAINTLLDGQTDRQVESNKSQTQD